MVDEYANCLVQALRTIGAQHHAHAKRTKIVVPKCLLSNLSTITQAITTLSHWHIAASKACAGVVEASPKPRCPLHSEPLPTDMLAAMPRTKQLLKVRAKTLHTALFTTSSCCCQGMLL